MNTSLPNDWPLDTKERTGAQHPPIPHIAEPYQPVYRPMPERFAGPDSAHYKTNALYEQWVPNDFTVAHDGKRWHLFGITHPCPAGYLGEAFDPVTIHEAEWQLFHAVSADGKTLRELMVPESFAQHPQVLTVRDRPNEPREIWAPIVWKEGGVYRMLYSPDPFRSATSTDLFHWTPQGTAFTAGASGYARDPNVFVQGETVYILYIGRGGLFLRPFEEAQKDTPSMLLRAALPDQEMESPILLHRDGWFYLFYCEYVPVRDKNNAYAHHTVVVAASSLEGLACAEVLTTLPAHAPEVIQDEAGTYYLFSVEFPWRGVNLTRLAWQ
jgi:beta-fructofuranosidase